MRRSFRFVFLLVVVVVCLGPVAAQDTAVPEPIGLRPDAPPYAQHGPHWVGTTRIEAETPFHPTSVQIWYPALNPDRLDEAVIYRAVGALSASGHAIQDAQPDSSGRPYPLVVLAHGLGVGNGFHAFVAEHLASQGFVVTAMDFADSGAMAQPSPAALTLYTRPRDVSWQLDFTEQLNADVSSFLYGMVDLEHVGIVGASLGGYTALVAGGAQLDLTGPTSWCAMHTDTILQTRYCGRADAIAELAGLASVPDARWPSWADTRIDVIVPLAPAAAFFGDESAQPIVLPALVMYGDSDRTVESGDPLYRSYVFDNLGSETKVLVVLSDADHAIFNVECDSAPWIAEFGKFPACSDPVWDMDRAHDLINHFTTAFLLSTLKSDSEATAALSPDAVAFPGIEYQAEGF